MSAKKMTLAVKCAPERKIFSDVQKAGIQAVELFLSSKYISRWQDAVSLCRDFAFRYCLHAPNDTYAPEVLADLAKATKAEVVVFHDIFWEDEWGKMIDCFSGSSSKLCIENTRSIHEPLKFMRRYSMSRCLDLEHLQMECSGVYEGEVLIVMQQASHVHLTGYVWPSRLWHTHIHHSPRHNRYMLNLLSEAGYSGLVVSEAKTSLQTYDEFRKLNDFFQRWKNS